MKNNYNLFISVVYLGVALLLIWFFSTYLLPSGFSIAGHDSGLALDSKEFLETRLFAWDERINFGEDNSLLFGSLTLHALDYFSSLIAGVPYAGNYVNLFFWLSAMFIAGFIFAYQLRISLGNSFAFIFPFFVVFNFYIFQSIFILERAKYSLVTATLLFLAILVRLIDKKQSILTGAILTSIIFSIFNGGSWLGLPLFGGLLIIVSVITFFILGYDIRKRRLENSRRFFSFILISGVLFILINSYSLFPYLQTFFKTDYKILQNTTTIDSNKAWLDYISQGSSFLNIFRMQGVPDWYETKYTPAPMHPFASFYLDNPFMVFLGFLIPIGAFAGLVLAKNPSQKKIISISAMTLLVSMVFMSASRSPWGFVYEFFYNHVPGFLIFRSSFYKFGYAFIITCSLMLAFTLSTLITLSINSKVRLPLSKNSLKVGLIFLVITGWIVYHQKLLSPNIFRWREGFSTQVQIPGYVDEYKQYVKNQNITEGRTLLLPKAHKVWLSDGYKWGYWSLSTIHYSLSRQPVISNSVGLNPEERNWVDLLYSSISSNETQETEKISERLGVSHFLLKMDALTGDDWSAGENPEDIKKILESYNFLEKENQFGEWILYKLKSPVPALFVTENNLTQVSQTDVSKISPFLESKRGVDEDSVSGDPEIKKIISAKIDNYECMSCVIEQPLIPKEFIWSRILPNSVAFPVKIAYENYQLQKIQEAGPKLNFYYTLILKRTAELSSMFFYKTHDAYLIGNLKMLRNYLETAESLISQTSNRESFADAKKLIDNIESVKSLLVNQLSADESFSMSANVKEEISRTIWSIDRLKNYYSFIFNDPDKWSSEKVFEINVESLPYQLYLDENSLPEAGGKKTFPEVILNGKTTAFDGATTRKVGNWIALPSQELKKGVNKLTLKFGAPANLLSVKQEVEINTPQGIRKCFKGDLSSRPKGDMYLLKVKTGGSIIKFFPKPDNTDEVSGFLDWNNFITINDYYRDEYFRFYYPVPKIEAGFSFYICGEHEFLPVYKEFIIQELFKPEVVGFEHLLSEAETKPEVSYERVNPTKYNVHVEPSQLPFVLIMNQKYSPNWILKTKAGDDEGKVPFKADLYATGWVINPEEGPDFVLEYDPQQYFYKGIVVSVVTLISLGVASLVIFRRAKK